MKGIDTVAIQYGCGVIYLLLGFSFRRGGEWLSAGRKEKEEGQMISAVELLVGLDRTITSRVL